MTTSSPPTTFKTALGSHAYFQGVNDGSTVPGRLKLEQAQFPSIIAAFRIMCRSLAYDISEMAVVTYFLGKAYGIPFTGIPVFSIAGYQHGRITHNVNAGLKTPKDLEGKKLGVRAYTVTPGVWQRGILQNEYGVNMDKVTVFTNDEEHVEAYQNAHMPPNIERDLNADLSKMLVDGDIAAGLGVPTESPDVKPLIEDARNVGIEQHKKTGVYPVVHTIVIKDSVLKEHPWVAPALYEAFKESKKAWQAKGENLPQDDPMPIGMSANRKTIEALVQLAVQQKILPRSMDANELYPGNLD